MPIANNEARVNITWARQNGDLPDPVQLDTNDGDILGFVTESVRGGDVPGIAADPNANFQNYMIERIDPSDAYPFNRILVRPKTAFGASQ